MKKLINQKLEITLDAEHAIKFMDILRYENKGTTPSDLIKQMIDLWIHDSEANE